MRDASYATMRLCPYRYCSLDIFPPVTCLLFNVHCWLVSSAGKAGWCICHSRRSSGNWGPEGRTKTAMYQYQTGALSKEGQRWFESQLYLSACDEQERAGFDLDSVSQQVGCSPRAYSALQGQLLRASSYHSAAPVRAQQSPDDWSYNHRIPSCLAAGRNETSRASAAASQSACRPDLAASGSQPARNSVQSSILEPQWLSPSSSRILPHQPRLQEQYVKQDCELMTSLLPSLAPGKYHLKSLT